MDLGLKGKRAIVTGGTGGIGRAIVRQLASEGAIVHTCSRRKDAVDALNEDMGEMGVTGSVCDVSDQQSNANWMNHAIHQMGGLDIFIANVSGMGLGGLEGWQLSFDVDIMATVTGADIARTAMKSSGGGSIVFISSISATESSGQAGPYGSMKAALISYAGQLGSETAAEGIRVNSISPGPIHVDDGFWGKVQQQQPEQYKAVEAMHGAGRMGTPEEVASAAVFIASPVASWVTRANLIVDGGFTRGIQF